MNSISLTKPNSGGVSQLAPEWLRIPQACAFSGLGRSTMFNLLKAGVIASKLVKTSKHNVSGCRVVSVESLRAAIEEAGI
jgi:hypothetical protein